MKRNAFKYLTLRERKALAEYLTRLRQEFGEQVQRVILYGSKVRGDFDKESDIDLFVVLQDTNLKLENSLTHLGVEVDLKYDVLLGDFVVSQKRFARMAEIQEPLYQSLMSEGVELWTNPPKALLEFGSKKQRTMLESRAAYSTKANTAKRSAARTTPSSRSRARRS